MKFDRSYKFDSNYYGKLNSLRLKLQNGKVNTFGGNIYFAGDGTMR